MKVVLRFVAGDVVIDVPGSRGVLVAPTEVDFGEQHPDIVAENFAAAGRVDLLKYLEHRDPVSGLLVKYNVLGTRIEVTEEQEEGLIEFGKVREAVERGVEEAFDITDEAAEDKISDKIAEEVARSTDAITSPSELAEASDAPPPHVEDPPIDTPPPDDAPPASADDVPPAPAADGAPVIEEPVANVPTENPNQPETSDEPATT